MRLMRRKIDDFLKEWKENEDRLPLIVKGARQIGKTASIMQFANDNYRNVVAINFVLQQKFKSIFDDGYDVDSVVRNITLINPNIELEPGNTIFFFDEMQDCPVCATSLKAFKIDGRYDVVCSGSLMGINYQEIESNSVGYKEDYTMHSMDFEEFHSLKKLSTLLLIAAVAAGIDANSAEVTRIAAGDHTMLLTKDGKIYVSGKNDAGQLGDGHYYDSEVSDNHYNATTFKPVEKDGVKFRSVTATLYNSYAIASDGALYAWGQNAYGQLGLVSVGTYSGIYTPTKVDDAKWAVVKGRSTTIVGIHTDGTLWAWGKNLTGQLGIGADSEMKECAMAPEKVSDERWIDCASGYYHSTAVKADGTLWAWGDNSQNQVNSSTTAIFTTPQQVGEDTDWTQVQAGLKMSAALKADGSLWTWGNNDESALGRAVEGKTDGKPMKAFDKVLSYSVGDMHVLVIKDDYTLWGWGYNLHGELANGTNRNIDTPTQIGTAQWQTVAAGFYHSVGVQIDGSVWSWGFNRYGQLGLGDDNNRAELSKVDFNPEEGAVAEIATDSAVKVYPTVAEETITVSSDATISSVSIYNANGQKVGFKMVDGTQTSLNVSHLAAGTYFVATESGAGKSVARFIKK